MQEKNSPTYSLIHLPDLIFNASLLELKEISETLRLDKNFYENRDYINLLLLVNQRVREISSETIIRRNI